MIDRIAYQISCYMISRGVLGQDYLSICKLGIEVIISTLITTAGILVLGYGMGMLWEAILFCLCFTTLRNYSGGYHAKTRISCNVITWLEAFGVLWTVKELSGIKPVMLWIEVVVVIVVFLLFAPLENKNKPLSSNIKNKNRKWMMFWLLFWNVMAVGMYGNHISDAITMINTQLMVMFLVILEKGKQKYEKKVGK